jgi:hypothetical protein
LVVEGAAAAFFFFLCFLAAGFGASVVVPEAAGASADIGAADFGISAAIAPAARPKVNKAEAITVPDLFIASPAVGKLQRREEYAGSIEFDRDEDHFTNCAAGIARSPRNLERLRVPVCTGVATRAVDAN